MEPEVDSGAKNDQTITPESIPIVNRQTLIETAIRFLQNPKVLPTPIEQKRLFLEKKGLTNTEIELALQNAGCYNTINRSPPINPYNNAQQYQQQDVLIQQNLMKNDDSFMSLVFRIAKWIANILFAGCVAFTAYKLLIKKYFLKEKSKVELEMEVVLKTNQNLEESVREMRQSLKSLNVAIESMSTAVRQLSIERNNYNSSNDADIKTELQSVKSLLLNRNNFPTIPTVTPLLPSWQLGVNSSILHNKKEADASDTRNGSEIYPNSHDSKDVNQKMTTKTVEHHNGSISDDNSENAIEN